MEKALIFYSLALGLLIGPGFTCFLTQAKLLRGKKLYVQIPALLLTYLFSMIVIMTALLYAGLIPFHR